jgi:hypothetical protein
MLSADDAEQRHHTESEQATEYTKDDVEPCENLDMGIQ